jgi:hypothetical protein
MKTEELLSKRLNALHVGGAAFVSAGELVAWLGAVQSQEFNHAKWALGARLPGLTEAEVDRAILNKEIVRAWVMRGTLHLLAAADLRWVVGLVRASNQAKTRPLHKKFDLDDVSLGRAIDAICAALQGGKALERSALFAAVEQQGISTEYLRGSLMLYEAAHLGHICLGPMAGRQDTYVLVEEWLAPSAMLSREAAVAELAKRYFQSHGPATLQDFVGWSGLGVREARAGVQENIANLERVVLGGEEYWMGGEALEGKSARSLLLPGFDEYLIAYRERGAFLARGHSSKVITSNGIFRPIIVVDGKVVGTWKQTLKKGRMDVELNGFEGVIGVDADLQMQMDALQQFLRP